MERLLTWEDWPAIVEYRNACIRAGLPELAGFWPLDIVLNVCPFVEGNHTSFEDRIMWDPIESATPRLVSPGRLKCSHTAKWKLLSPSPLYRYEPGTIIQMEPDAD